MKKDKPELNDWGRAEYKRSDLGTLVRGKYSKRAKQSSNIVILDPEVAEAFPSSEAVNKALRKLISPKRVTKKTSEATKRKKTSSQRKTAASTR